MDQKVFIARVEQLSQLRGWLAEAVEGHGSVRFISGEAGSGKTTLVNEFSSRALEQYNDLAVAVGQCNAQSGVGDAHLPFREIMAQLTGDVDAKLAQGLITDENANRLRKLLVLSGQALVDVGPDLVGIFVPGIGLVTRLGAFVAEKAGWLDRLEKLAGKPKEKAGESGLQESQIFEQFANVLCRLAQKHPLLLVLDDMHWADSASISLLFHLGRRIEGHKILILATYRSAEVAIGRAGERHPLEKVMAELKRYFKDTCLDLDQVVKDEGRLFVDSFLDSEPNLLKDDFSQKLHHHTGGHPLFTIELLRNMQERGDLVKDEHGRWVESACLNWETLPKRVEGVIEERIGRLQQELRQVLTIGSVQGEDFTAEVVARVQKAEAGGLIRRLSGELERQHRLVSAEGTRRLDPGGQRLSGYRFQHNLFRTYLYNELGDAERAYLHEDVGNALEALYADQAEDIAVQLAIHFEAAGLDEKARHYLFEAGKQAVQSYANNEAIGYFSRALDLTPQSEPEKRYDLLLAREQVYGLKGERDLEKIDLEMLQDLGQKINNQGILLEIMLRKTAFGLATSNYQGTVNAAKETIRLAEILDEPKVKAQSYFNWGFAALRLGNYEDARENFSQALAISEMSGFKRVEADSLRGLGSIALEQSDQTNAMEYYEKALKISQDSGDRSGASKALNNLGLIFCGQGDYQKSIRYFSEALAIFKEIGDQPREATILGNLGMAYAEQCDLQTAWTYFEQSRQLSHEVESRDLECQMLGNLGNVAAQLGDLNTARDYVEQALILDREIGFQYGEVINLNSLGSLLTDQGDYLTAREYLNKSLDLSKQLELHDFSANTIIKLGTVCECLGDFKGAESNYESGLEIIRNIDDKPGEAYYWVQMGSLYHHLGKDEEAYQYLLKAAGIAREFNDHENEAGALTHLGNTLVCLGKLGQAKDFYNKAQTLREKNGQIFKANESMAGLARAFLTENKPVEALEFVEKIIYFLASNSLDGTDEPMLIYLTCYQVLKTNRDPRAGEILKSAHSILLKRAELLKDESIRKSYLENVAANYGIQKEYTDLV